VWTGWLDERQLRPGVPVQPAMEQGIGPWQQKEVLAVMPLIFAAAQRRRDSRSHGPRGNAVRGAPAPSGDRSYP